MRAIKLHFVKPSHLEILLSDNELQTEIKYLNPKKLDTHSIGLYDPILQHYYLDTEMVVLSIFARAIKRLVFSNSNHNIVFLNPYVGQQKGGFAYNNEIIIDSTDIEMN
jgi:hypothetical protein